ncbi:MAG: hypothetical protein M3548_02460 [Actinomycetota bacterium]|nr:hypothetical protein [Actinomycetota bacterium]
MWRIGFRLWSAWQHFRLGGLGVLLLVLIYHAQGASVLFWLVALATAAVLYGARTVLVDLARREGVTPATTKTTTGKADKR